MKVLVFQRLTIVQIAVSKEKIKNFSFIIDYNVQFEPEEPPNRALVLRSQMKKGIFENLMVRMVNTPTLMQKQIIA